MSLYLVIFKQRDKSIKDSESKLGSLYIHTRENTITFHRRRDANRNAIAKSEAERSS